MAIESPWRIQSRRVIKQVLSNLGPFVTLAEKKKAISAAYPFGLRKCYPYQCWLAEVKKLLAKHQKTPAPLILLGPYMIECQWCHNQQCLACANIRRQLTLFSGDRQEWHRLLNQAIQEPEAVPILADWLEEHGLQSQADWTRSSWNPKLMTRVNKLSPTGEI